jgi:1,4-alpha-glucan branching enzyme
MTGTEKGYLTLVLHAHLPYVRHPEYDEFLEEDWFFEALTETYIPIIEVFDRLIEEGVDFRVTMSLTPSLISMMTDPLLQFRYLRHLNKLIDLAAHEIERTRWTPEFHELALMYHWKFTRARQIFVERYNSRLMPAFKRFQDLGRVEIISCAATHGFLPLMLNKTAARAQIEIAAAHYEKHLGRRPRGIWLPECGYVPGIDELLKGAGIRYFIVDTHGILFGSPRPRYGVFAPVYCPSAVAAFGRDMESSKQVWSARDGYPGDYEYREFYRDIGFDLDYDYIRPYLHDDGNRINLGIKYYKITGPTNHKEPYLPGRAREKAAEHAGNFMFNREKQIEWLNDFLGIKPIIVSPYDAELFGHWWYEGPEWIEFLMRKLRFDQSTIQPITPSEYLERHPKLQVLEPSMSSWGWKGYNEVWLEGSNDWIYPHLHIMADRMVELANRAPDAQGLMRRALNQAARELLLAQSSDWAFIMKTGTMVEYALKRTKDHIGRFDRLYNDITVGRVNEQWLAEVESRDNIFPDVDYRSYADSR